MQKTIITCAVTGAGAITARSVHVPRTPAQIADEVIAAARAGAAIAHIHVRDPESGSPSMELAHYSAVAERVRASGVDVVVNLTTGAGGRYIPDPADPLRPAPGSTLSSPEARVRHVLALKPEICSLDVCTMNFGQHAFINVPAHLEQMARLIRQSGAKPELEVFDLGHIRLARHLIDQGLIDVPPLFQLCLGVPWGVDATPEMMMTLSRALPPGAKWAGFGISRMSFPMVAQAVLLGGHVRVGLEDNLYLDEGVLAQGNAQLVERAVRIIESLGAAVASPQEAREMLGLVKGH
jgi:uncharacterized protein (DUF849 family)